MRKKIYNIGDVFTLDKEKEIKYILLGHINHKGLKDKGSYAFMCVNCGHIITFGGPSAFLKSQKNKISLSKDVNDYCKLHNATGYKIMRLMYYKKVKEERL